MSFVLDALKISERRRSKFARPVYVHPPRPFRARRRRSWIAGLGTVAAIALVFVVWRLVTPPPSSSSNPAAGTSLHGPADATPGASDDKAASPVRTARDEGAFAQDEAGSQLPGYGVAPVGAPAAIGGPGASEGWNTVSDENPNVALRIEPLLSAPPADWPALELQMLFYSSESGRSFAQINGESYRVGDRLEEGPQVQEIRGEGVILTHAGQRVRLTMER